VLVSGRSIDVGASRWSDVARVYFWKRGEVVWRRDKEYEGVVS
jgi:hypothetical protein